MNWPRIVSEASQQFCPTSFDTSKMYSPLSFVSVFRIFSMEHVSVLWILYLWPEASSFPPFSQVALRGLVPENRHSRAAGSPWVTLIDFASSVILAGSDKTVCYDVKQDSHEVMKYYTGASWETSEPTFYCQNSKTFLAPCLVVRQAGVLASVVGMYTGNVEAGDLMLICNLNVFSFLELMVIFKPGQRHGFRTLQRTL